MEGGGGVERPGSAARRPGVEADSARRLACRLARWSSRAGKAREGVGGCGEGEGGGGLGADGDGGQGRG